MRFSDTVLGFAFYIQNHFVQKFDVEADPINKNLAKVVPPWIERAESIPAGLV